MLATVIPSSLLMQIDFLRLGRFIKNIDKPNDEYCDPQTSDALKVIFKDFSTNTNQDSAKIDFGSGLSSLFSERLSRQLQSQIEVAPERGVSYELEDSDAWFDKVVSLPDTREWIENAALSGDRVYFIVGVQTLDETRIAQKATRKEHLGNETNLSVAAVAAVMPFAELVDVPTQGEQRNLGSDEIWIKAPSQQACSIRCREVKVRRLSSQPTEPPQPSNTRRWVRKREGKSEEHAEDDGNEDLIEVDIQDVLELSGKWDTRDFTEGTIYLQS
ncbi:hypothetical protein EDB81DRAFT_778373 [Dactylonectria macrodidyma]|uniref:Uncharacterized protein n=1 Tax=Dactylonectria macrodidyma TaxID=307937 RepID=A0A9P9FRS2_9HYPO|nr:hypothetical protein EDB81DRAFT_778373 [Dactylonectria macrodidyma]